MSKLLENIGRGTMIQIYRNYETPEELMYLSKLVSIVDNKAILLAPVSKGALVPFSMTLDYTFHMLTPENKIVGVDTRFLKVAKKDALNLVVFELVGNIRRIQRRNFLRLSTHIPIYFKRQTLHESPKYEGVALDLGGGGIRMVTKELIKEGETLKFNIPVVSDNIPLLGKVLQKSDVTGDAIYPYEYRIEFVDISNVTQEGIVRYIFDKQTEGLGN